MNKFSVVIPTMWRYTPFLNFLQDLTKFDVVNDIIVINNNIADTPNNPILQHEKVRLINHPKNIYVNPAWNQGVHLSLNDKICILNDDMIFDLKMFYHVDAVLNEHSGALGICPGLAEFNQRPITSGAIQIVPWKSTDHTFGFGSLMFVHKAWWIDIPSDFVLYYGDNWIFDTCLIRSRQNYLITDALHFTPYATTCKEIPNNNEMLESEAEAFSWHKENFKKWVDDYRQRSNNT